MTATLNDVTKKKAQPTAEQVAALGVERQDHLVDAVEAALPLAHDLRLERARPIARNLKSPLDRSAR